jgi:putative iron-regulated protein
MLVAAVAATAGAAHAETTAGEVIDGYATLAHTQYSDALTTAQALDEAIKAFVAAPSDETLDAAKSAWLTARVAYQQTEAFRFGNPIVDDWEGKVNAWPLDEGLIDYVDPDFYGDFSEENDAFTANVIANPSIEVGGSAIDASEITPALLEELHEVDGIDANVATGYHAIEFMLWGQDTNGTDAGAGNRPYTDFVEGEACTGGNCDRRADYLTAASALLVSDLEYMVGQWSEGGEALAELKAKPEAEGIATILTGMGSLSYGELAGERMKLGLILHDPEEEHDCFADNTHNSHYYDAKGIQGVYLGSYTTSTGETIDVPSLADLAAEVDADLNAEVTAKLAATMDAMGVMKERADSGTEAYDQMIGYGNDEGNAIVQAAIDALIDQTRSFESLVAALDASEITVEGSDSLDNPGAVFE